MDYTDVAITDCLSGNEGEMLLFALARVHRQFAWKTGGLDAGQLARTHPRSQMTLAGLVKHLAFVEDGFTARAAGLRMGAPWDERDWQENDVWTWESATSDDPAALYTEAVDGLTGNDPP